MGSSIEWTEQTWNPVTGCTPVSPGCLNCYAARQALRLRGMGVAGYADGDDPHSPRRIAEVRADRPVFTGSVRCVESRLADPLRWRTPRLVFVNSMSDLFHEDVPFGFIDRVFAVMALCPRHTFQILTKRPERMAEYLNRRERLPGHHGPHDWKTPCDRVYSATAEIMGVDNWKAARDGMVLTWPLPNVWLGTSCEDQAAADARIPHLLRCPAAVRFLSCEPLLGEVDLRLPMTVAKAEQEYADAGEVPLSEAEIDEAVRVAMRGPTPEQRAAWSGEPDPMACIDWVIVGGESGPKARPCNVEWIRSIVRQCQGVGVPVFVEQLGRRVLIPNDTLGEWPDEGERLIYDAEGPGWSHQGELVEVEVPDKKRKGGDPAEWPEDLRVREMPAARGAVAAC